MIPSQALTKGKKLPHLSPRPLILFRLFGLLAVEAVIGDLVSSRFSLFRGKIQRNSPASGLEAKLVPAFVVEIQSLSIGIP
jgi:hypothetical protein